VADAPLKRLSGWITQYSYMPLTVEDEPENGQLTSRGAEDRLLELVVGSAGRPLTREAGYLEVRRLVFLLTGRHGSFL
jgi:hypothetical protein